MLHRPGRVHTTRVGKTQHPSLLPGGAEKSNGPESVRRRRHLLLKFRSYENAVLSRPLRAMAVAFIINIAFT